MISFLSAHWTDLIVVNFQVDPALLRDLVPNGTELDSFSDQHFVSVVGFLFRNTKFLGILPTYPVVNFEEVNLRFYIKRNENRECRKGVAFVKEVVPSRIIASVARNLYNEPYVALPMSHEKQDSLRAYSWDRDDDHCHVRVQINPAVHELTEGSFPHFILEHYWGYTAQADGSTLEYRVEHPPWVYHEVTSLDLSADAISRFYGPQFTSTLLQKPHSCFVAEGSHITVGWPRRIHHT